MKKENVREVIFAAVVLLTGIITIGSFGISETGSKTQFSSKASYPIFEGLNGAVEVNLIPAGDNRIWHIESIYNLLYPDKEQEYNTAEFIFTKDSVKVINNYAGVPNKNP